MALSDEEAEERLNFIESVFRGADMMSDRSIVITCAAGLEACTIKILSAHINNECRPKDLFSGPTAPFGTFSARITISLALGLISKSEADALNLVRSVRNKFAHEIDASFENEKIVKLCGKSKVLDDRMILRDEFHHMSMNILTKLVYRDLELLESSTGYCRATSRT